MTRYANDTLCHVWASGKKDSAQSNHGSLYFEGRALYSYGRHYCVGFLMGDNTVLLNSTRASVTTSKHCSYAARATSHMARHYVPELEDIVSALIAATDGTIEQWQRNLIARHAEKHIQAIQPGTASYLMRLSGKRNPDKAAALRQAISDMRAMEAALEAARNYAAMTAAERVERIAALASQWSPIDALKVAASNARKAHKAAKGRGWNAIAASVWAYIRALDSKRRWIEANQAAHKARKYLRGKVRAARGYAARDMDSIETWELRRVTDCFGYIARNGKGLSQCQRDRLLAIANRADSIRNEREAIDAARRFEREREAREAWLNGASGYWRGNDGNGGALIRATGVERDESGTITGGTLETSQGANVPLIHAVRIFQIARACREAGRAMEPRARVGFYTVNRIDETGGFNAGCHRINWQEIERLATLLGLYP